MAVEFPGIVAVQFPERQLFVAGSPVIAGLDDNVQVYPPLGPLMVAVKFTARPTPLTCVTLGVKLVTLVVAGAAPAGGVPMEPSTATRPERRTVTVAMQRRRRERMMRL